MKKALTAVALALIVIAISVPAISGERQQDCTSKGKWTYCTIHYGNKKPVHLTCQWRGKVLYCHASKN